MTGSYKSLLPLVLSIYPLRGSLVTARLADLYEDRFIAFAFLGGGYTAPRTEFDMEQALALTKKMLGYELIGYWKFFSEPDAPELIEHNVRQFSIPLWSDPTHTQAPVRLVLHPGVRRGCQFVEDQLGADRRSSCLA